MEEAFGWRVRQHCPKALRIIDTQDLHFLRRGRECILGAGGAHACLLVSFLVATMDEIMEYKGDVSDNVFLREIAAILRSDMSFLVSTHELSILTRTWKIPKSKVCFDFSSTLFFLAFYRLLFLSSPHHPSKKSWKRFQCDRELSSSSKQRRPYRLYLSLFFFSFSF